MDKLSVFYARVPFSSLLCGSGFFLSILFRSSALYPSFRRRDRPKVVDFLVRNGTMLVAVGATAIVGHRFDLPGLTSTARLFGTLWGLQKCAESFAVGVPALVRSFSSKIRIILPCIYIIRHIAHWTIVGLLRARGGVGWVRVGAGGRGACVSFLQKKSYLFGCVVL